MPDLIYVGNCGWEPSGNPEPSRPPLELPTIREPWIGRQDQTSAFLAAHPIGGSHLGGYIIENTPRDNTPFEGVASVDLIVALPPDFLTAKVENSTSYKTATRTATVESSLIIPGATSVDAERAITYAAPETTYTYFASSAPSGPRYTSVATSAEARVLSSRVTARGEIGDGQQIEKKFTGALAPAALVTALTMAPVDKGTSHQSAVIPGTPWYRCTDVVTRELEGDT